MLGKAISTGLMLISAVRVLVLSSRRRATRRSSPWSCKNCLRLLLILNSEPFLRLDPPSDNTS